MSGFNKNISKPVWCSFKLARLFIIFCVQSKSKKEVIYWRTRLLLGDKIKACLREKDFQKWFQETSRANRWTLSSVKQLTFWSCSHPETTFIRRCLDFKRLVTKSFFFFLLFVSGLNNILIIYHKITEWRVRTAKMQ